MGQIRSMTLERFGKDIRNIPNVRKRTGGWTWTRSYLLNYCLYHAVCLNNFIPVGLQHHHA